MVSSANNGGVLAAALSTGLVGNPLLGSMMARRGQG